MLSLKTASACCIRLQFLTVSPHRHPCNMKHLFSNMSSSSYIPSCSRKQWSWSLTLATLGQWMLLAPVLMHSEPIRTLHKSVFEVCLCGHSCQLQLPTLHVWGGERKHSPWVEAICVELIWCLRICELSVFQDMIPWSRQHFYCKF